MKATMMPMATDIPLTNAPIRPSAHKSSTIAGKGQQNEKKFDSVLSEKVKAASDIVDTEEGSGDRKTADQADNVLAAGVVGGGVLSLVKPVVLNTAVEEQPNNPSVSAISSKQEQSTVPVMGARVVTQLEGLKPLLAEVQLNTEATPTLEQNGSSEAIAQPQVAGQNLIKPQVAGQNLIKPQVAGQNLIKLQVAVNKLIPGWGEKLVQGDDMPTVNILQDSKLLKAGGVSGITDAKLVLNSLVNPKKLGLVEKVNPVDQSQLLDTSLVHGQNQASSLSDFTSVDQETGVAAIQLNTSASSGNDGNAESGLAADTLIDTTELIRKNKATVSEATPFSSILDQHGVKAEAITVARSDASPQAPADRYNVLGQIVDQARVISRPNNSEMVIKLKPEHLGELTLKIVVENGVVSAKFLSNNADVRSAIESSLPQLRQELSNQGLKVDQVGVYASLNQSFGNNQRQPQYQEQPTKNMAEPRDSKEFINTVEMVAASAPKNHIASGIDYRI